MTDAERIECQLDTMQRIVQSWLDEQEKDFAKEGKAVADDSVFMCTHMPWNPSRVQFQHWVQTMQNARDLLKQQSQG